MNLTKTVGNVKIGFNPNMSSIQGLYTYGIAAQTASQVWLGMSGVRGVLGSIPGGNHLLVTLDSNEID